MNAAAGAGAAAAAAYRQAIKASGTLVKIEPADFQRLLNDQTDLLVVTAAPGGIFNEVGLKRHYKTPEPVKALRSAPQKR